MQNNSLNGSSLRQSIRHICLIPVKEARAAEAQIVMALFSKSYSIASGVMFHLAIQILRLRRNLKSIDNTSNFIETFQYESRFENSNLNGNYNLKCVT